MLSYKLDRTVKCYYYRYVYNLQANVQRRRNLTQAHTWVYGGFTAPGRRWHQLNGATAYAAHTERVGYVGCGVCTVHCMSWPCGLRSPMRRDGPVPLPVLGPRLLAEDLAETQRRRPS